MRIIFRHPKPKDLGAVHKVAQEYYQGFEISKEVLTGWIKDLPKQFIIIEIKGEIAGCIFWEYLNEIKAIPYFHKVKNFNQSKGKYAYISEIVIADKYKNKGIMWLLYGAMGISLKKECQGIIWVTGEPRLTHRFPHVEAEQTILKIDGFKLVKRAKNWEYAPENYVSDHNIYFKKI